jgi:hypothetical protein
MSFKKPIFKLVIGTLVFSLLLSSVCFVSSASSAADVSATNSGTNDSLYHKYFDLNDLQKSELTQRGYSDAQISKIDSQSFAQLESTWKLTADDMQSAKNIYPQLKNVDLSTWTYNDFESYSEKQDDANYAPTSEQASELAKRGISLKMARRLLKEYCTYDNLLAQSDSELSSMIAEYTEADNEYNSFQNNRQQTRNMFLNDHSVN